jgi:hypothetical protein
MADNATREFAWDGFAFGVPRDWNLAGYDFGRRSSRVRMEDDDALRLEFEWTRAPKFTSMPLLRARYETLTRQWSRVALEVRKAAGLPEGWAGFIYRMPDQKWLATVFCVRAESNFCGIFRLHFERTGHGEPLRVVKRLADSFKLASGPDQLWACYDMAFRLDRRFRLTGTVFEAGRKRMTFEWRLRRLWIWQFSLADMTLHGAAPPVFVADFLNTASGIRGPHFVCDKGRIAAVRRRRYPFGHADEIGRMCFKYHAGYVFMAVRNQLALYVFQHRHVRDLAMIKTLEIGDGHDT